MRLGHCTDDAQTETPTLGLSIPGPRERVNSVGRSPGVAGKPESKALDLSVARRSGLVVNATLSGASILPINVGQLVSSGGQRSQSGNLIRRAVEAHGAA